MNLGFAHAKATTVLAPVNIASFAMYLYTIKAGWNLVANFLIVLDCMKKFNKDPA